jgi:hypothetical protein
MNTMLSALSQGYGVCRKDGLVLIPEASGAIPAYSAQIKVGFTQTLTKFKYVA